MKNVIYKYLAILTLLLFSILISCTDDEGNSTEPIVVDTEAPAILQVFPKTGANDVAPSTRSLSLVFSEVVKRNQGDIVVYNGADEVLYTIPIGDANSVTINGALVTISLPTSLEKNQSYYVQIASGAITDVAENDFEGFTNNSSWAFATPVEEEGNSDAAKLILHLPFDTDLSDSSGNLLHATEGATSTGAIDFVNDSERGGVVFFNVGAYATLPKDSALRPLGSESFSVNFWIKHVATGSDPVILGNSSWDSGGNPGWLIASDGADSYVPDNDYTNGHGWTVNLSATAAGSDRLDWDAGDCDVPGGNPANLGDNSWHMVTMVIDQTNKLLKVYSDGVQYSEPAKDNTYDLNRLAGGALFDTANDYPVNIWEDGTGTYNTTHGMLEGHLDDLKIYSGVLTQSEITALFTE